MYQLTHKHVVHASVMDTVDFQRMTLAPLFLECPLTSLKDPGGYESWKVLKQTGGSRSWRYFLWIRQGPAASVLNMTDPCQSRQMVLVDPN